MSVSRKPRRRYDPLRHVSPVVDEKIVDKSRETISNAELAIRTKLPLGIAEKNDMACLRDTFNIGLVMICARTWIDDDARVAAKDDIDRAFEAWHQIWLRGLDSEHYVAKGDELRLIFPALAWVCEEIETSLRETPRQFYHEFCAFSELCHGPDCHSREGKQLSFPVEVVQEAVRNAYRRGVIAAFKRKGWRL